MKLSFPIFFGLGVLLSATSVQAQIQQQDREKLRIVLTARLCLFTRLLNESRLHPSKQTEKPVVFEILLADTKKRLGEANMTALSCGGRLLKNVMACLPSMAGSTSDLPIDCNVYLSSYVNIDAELGRPNLDGMLLADQKSLEEAENKIEQPSKKVISLLHSAQACANDTAEAWTASYGRRLRRMGVEDNEDPRPFREASLAARAAMKAAHVQALSCSNPTVKKLIYCLPSVERIGLGAVGTPYGGPWCEQEPYRSAVVLEQRALVATRSEKPGGVSSTKGSDGQ